MDYSVFPKTAEEWSERMKGAAPPTPDDQSRTWDGRILNSKEAVLEFLAELEEIRTSGGSLHPLTTNPDDPVGHEIASSRRRLAASSRRHRYEPSPDQPPHPATSRPRRARGRRHPAHARAGARPSPLSAVVCSWDASKRQCAYGYERRRVQEC